MEDKTARLEFWEVQWKLALAQLHLGTCQVQQKVAPSLETATAVQARLDEITELMRQVQAAVAWQDAAGLAYQERTGMEPADGQEFTAADAERADAIMAYYPK